MRRALLVLLMAIVPAVAVAARPIIIITPKGAYQIDVVDGVPSAPHAVTLEVDIIVHGFGDGTVPVPPVVDPPATDPIVQQIATISKATLRDKDEATAVAALINTLAKFNLSGTGLKNALDLSAGVLDSTLDGGGRVISWVSKVTAVTLDPAKLRAGLVSAFGLDPSTLETIHQASIGEAGAALTGEAVNWEKVIKVIQAVITLLRQFGLIA